MTHPSRARISLLIAFVFALCAISTTQAQTFTVLHDFTGGADGALPQSGLTLDNAGNLYGTASEQGGGGQYAGTVFELKKHSNGSWIFDKLYHFQPSQGDGGYPLGRVVFGPERKLYGTTAEGANTGCFAGLGCGIVYSLQPRATVCTSVQCEWNETILHVFSGNADGGAPGHVDPIFDRAGNLYGTTQYGGVGLGVVFTLAPSNGGWDEQTIYTFPDPQGPCTPDSGLVFDPTGNLYGTTAGICDDSHDQGSVYQLKPSGQAWTANILRIFQGQTDGWSPTGGLVFDNAGNLYGATWGGGTNGSGAVFTFQASGGTWNYSQIYSGFTGNGGPFGTLTIDADGNLYGTTQLDGAYGMGSVFKLTHTGGGWSYATIHDFTGGADGGNIAGGVALDSSGDLFGTAVQGGAHGQGLVWEIVQ